MGANAPIMFLGGFMTTFKLSSLILLYFFTRIAFSAEPKCQDLKSPKATYKVCWDDALKGWLSESCIKEECAAKKFLRNPMKAELVVHGSKNPASEICHHLKLDVEILKDAKGNQQSYCIFKDKSMVDTAAMEKK